jgi:hypothetical protein
MDCVVGTSFNGIDFERWGGEMGVGGVGQTVEFKCLSLGLSAAFLGLFLAVISRFVLFIYGHGV